MLVTQPAQSPDTNHLDLAFFRALQSAQWHNRYALEMYGLIEQVISTTKDWFRISPLAVLSSGDYFIQW
jgi:hypothetical protein